MSLRNGFRYAAELTARDGRALGTLAIEPDFVPAAESAYFAAMRAGAVPVSAHHGPGVIEPVYDEREGSPYVSGLRLRFDAAPASDAIPVIPACCLSGTVGDTAGGLVRTGTLQAGETFTYRICAFARTASPHPHPPDEVDEEAAQDALPLKPASAATFLARATRLGDAAWDDGDFPVFLHSRVLEDATRMARAAGELECGGILVGHLLRDAQTPEICTEITALIPATKARAGRAHLGFTPETWSAMNDALALRGRQERVLGWFHSHPFFCAACPFEQRARCLLSQPFFSREDQELHRLVFDAAFNIALLLSDTGRASLHYDLFGWRLGSIAARGCHVLSASEQASPPAWIHGAGNDPARILNLGETDHER